MIKKLFDFIKSPKFFGMSCVAAAAFIMALLITDDVPFWVEALDIIVFWTLVATGYKTLNKLDFDNELNFWIKQCYDYKIYRECDKGEKQFDINIPGKIAALNYTEYVGKNFPYFVGHMNDKFYTYVITDARINEDDIGCMIITFTKIKDNEGEQIMREIEILLVFVVVTFIVTGDITFINILRDVWNVSLNNIEQQNITIGGILKLIYGCSAMACTIGIFKAAIHDFNEQIQKFKEEG